MPPVAVFRCHARALRQPSAGTMCVTAAPPVQKSLKHHLVAPDSRIASGAGLSMSPVMCVRGCLTAASPRGLLPCCALGPCALAFCAVQVYKTFKSFKLSDEPSELTDSQLDDLRRILSYWAVMGCSLRLPCSARLLRCCPPPAADRRPCCVGWLGADRGFPFTFSSQLAMRSLVACVRSSAAR